MPLPVDTKPTSSRRTPFLFIVGCPRSGTTLLQRMIDAHPLLAVANDTHFIPRALKKSRALEVEATDDLASLALTPALVDCVRRYHRFPRLGLSEAQVDQAAATTRTYSGFVGRLYLAFAQNHGKSLGGEKTPDYVRSLPLLHALFPWVKSMHIIRDGRDVALSTLQWANSDKGPGKLALWNEEPIAVCALWWHRQVATGRRDAENLEPGSYHEVKYEQLVEDPAEVLRAITDFLGLHFAREMLSFNEGKARRQPGLSAKKAWIDPTPGLRDWRRQMAERSIELFEALAGDLLSQLGYERVFDRVSPGIATVAQRCRAWWRDNRDLTAHTIRAAPVTAHHHRPIGGG